LPYGAAEVKTTSQTQMSLCEESDDHFVPFRVPSWGGRFPQILQDASKVANPAGNRDPSGLALILLFTGLFQDARRGFMDVELVTKRVQAEFEEMPGMTLTMRQASLLFGIERETCKAVVDRLVRTHYLKWTTSGAFTRTGR
jgi:hypothetical protein